MGARPSSDSGVRTEKQTCVLANLWYRVKQTASRNFPSLNQSVLAAISVLDGDRQRNQSKDLARGAQISEEGFAGVLTISGCLWLSGQESRVVAPWPAH